MAKYTYPEMPLEGRVWFAADQVPPAVDSDVTVWLSLSPVRPEDFFRATPTRAVAAATHIIRTAPDSRFGDNWVADTPNFLLPATVFEVDPFSEHFYVAIWAHEVGAGFANHHARIYAVRTRIAPYATLPIFEGWI